VLQSGPDPLVAGVMGRGFFYPADDIRHAQAWIPFTLGDRDRSRADDQEIYHVIARLHSGVSSAQAQAELNVLQKPLAALYPDNFSRALTVW
jgi:hypothetical protein